MRRTTMIVSQLGGKGPRQRVGCSEYEFIPTSLILPFLVSGQPAKGHHGLLPTFIWSFNGELVNPCLYGR